MHLYDFMFMTISCLLLMSLASLLFCLCMKLRNLELQQYILALARYKGIKLDPDKLELKPVPVCDSPHASQNCTIIIPDVAIIL